MRTEWGRAKSANGANIQPVYTCALVLLSLVATLGIEGFRYVRIWTPLQRHYLHAYLGSQIAGAFRDNGWYNLLHVATRNGSRLALDSDVVPTITEGGENTFALTKEAVKQGALLDSRRGHYNNAEMHAYLGNLIYQNQTVMDLVRPGLWGGLVIFLVGMLPASYLDRKRSDELCHGRKLRGPELMTVAQFSRKHRSQVFRFAHESRTVVDRMLGLNKMLHVPLRKENPHFLIVGDNTAGKTQLILHLLLQIEARNELAIVHDPGQEYTPRFYKPGRGDVILNPFDQRMPFWNIGDEVRSHAEASAVAACLFPDRHNLDPLFAETPRKIFTHLLTHNPAPQQLIQWMSDPAAIDRLVAGTSYAARIGPQSPSHRNSVLSSLHRVADALRLLPTEKDSKTRWNTAEWSKKPMGWVFLPSTNSTRECLMPLVSLWLDLLVMRLFDERVGLDIGSLRPTWFVLDEVALLQNLLKLHDAIARNLNANNPVVLGMQRRNQWQKHHGLDAEAMLSQSGTKIFLRTSEPETAKWISDTIGEVEIEQLRESRWQEPWRRSPRSKNYQLERRIEPLVLASQITGLEDRRGYLKSGNAVVQLSFSYVDLPKVQPALIARVPEVSPEEPPKTAAAVAGVNDSPGSDDVREAPAVAEQRTNQNRQLEHTALPAKRRFFE